MGAKTTKVHPWRWDWFEPEVFQKQIYCIEESSCQIVGTFRRPHSNSSPEELCPPCPLLRPCPAVVKYNSHIIKYENFLAYFMRILNSCVVSKFRTKPSVFAIAAAYLLSARQLFDETCTLPDAFAVVNCPVVALSVLYSTVLISSVYFCSCETLT